MKHIGNLQYAEGSIQKKKRIGRGAGSGRGGTSTRGHKGHQSRTGYNQTRGFEGGQMPLSRRVPKNGFTNLFRVEYEVVNVELLQKLADAQTFSQGVVTTEILRSVGAVKRNLPVKVLGNGTLTTALTVTVDAFSESAKSKIENAGGSVVTNG
jgi:large subunit ribosomal protein L15